MFGATNMKESRDGRVVQCLVENKEEDKKAYFGASAAAPVVTENAEEDDDILPLPVINYNQD